MNSKAKKALVINPRLRLMSNITSRPKKINKKIVLMGLDNSGKTSIVMCLKGVKNLSIEQLQGAKTLYQTKLEPELMKKVKTNNPNLLKEPISQKK